jgi:4-amino-4-deoxy-L-arabinose transferase-like glycosyltransferase
MARAYLEKKLFLWAALGMAAGMLLCLGAAPLYLEEPRRALIALEMFHSGNYWAATQFGEWYYYKPPVFNWVLVLFARLGGGFDEFWLRLPTVFDAIRAGLGVTPYSDLAQISVTRRQPLSAGG